ncbi:ATP-dependent rRNA helicase spb4 [Phlyctochytrium planicorne]|nr:ATP-dependent rRNA helicase spb4 [Phlyctochytrium planicorne]
MGESMGSLIRTGLRNPIKICVSRTESGDAKYDLPSSLRVFYQILPYESKMSALVQLCMSGSFKIIVYFATCAVVDYFYALLSSALESGKLTLPGYNLVAFHGKMDGKERLKVLNEFKNSMNKAVLFTTDVSSRGLDMPDIDWVVQFDPPQDPRTFNHRCGRTARSGKIGQAIIYLMKSEELYIDFLTLRNSMNIVKYEEMAEGEFTSEQYLEMAKSVSLGDDAIRALGLKAFVSWIRYYGEHQASAIFDIKKVDIETLSRSFGLQKLPKLRETSTLQKEELVIALLSLYAT